MAWKLDNPYSYDPGDGTPIESYTHIKIVHFAFSMEEVMRTELAIHLRHGTMRTLDEEVVFIPGKRNFVAVVFKDFHEVLDGAGGVLKEADPVLSIFMATAIGTAADVGKRKYDVIKADIWTRLLADKKIGAGEIV